MTDNTQKSNNELLTALQQSALAIEAQPVTEQDLAQLVLDVAGVIFVVLSRSQHVTLINAKGCEILGYPEAEIVGKNWFDHFVPAEMRKQTARVFDQLMRQEVEPAEYFENPVLTRSGQQRTIAWHNTLVKDSQGVPVATLSSGTDITDHVAAQQEIEHYKTRLEKLVKERTDQLEAVNHQLQSKIEEQKRTEETLLESQVRFAGILDIANEAIIAVDNSQTIVLFNKGAEQIFGYQTSEAIGHPLDMLIPERYKIGHRHLVGDFAHINEPARLMGVRGEIYGVRKNGQEFPASASISKLVVNDKMIFAVVLRDITERKQMEHERERRIVELRALNESVRAISAELSLEQVLQKVTRAAQILLNVKYAALGLHDGEGRLSRFITVGIAPEEHEKIGPLPAGRGLLGYLLHHGKSIIVNNIAQHPRSAGFPENHPQMTSLLGVPVYSKGRLIGALYLTDKQDGSDFVEADQQLVEMLAVHAAIAIENAQLYEQTQRLAILEERERFARDLHDGIIQSIYAVGLALDQAKMDIRPTNYSAREQIEISLKSLASVIKDIRNYIFDLRPEALKYQGLKARLEGLIKELRVNTLLPIYVEIAPNIDASLTEMQARHIFHISHEALSNAARHAKASHISYRLVKTGNEITVLIEDDGVGFDLHPQIKPGHHGLANMQARAAQLNAFFDIDSRLHEGTRLKLVIHSSVKS